MSAPGDTQDYAHRPISSIRERAVLAGRSIYYGILIYLADWAGPLWAAVFVQAAVVLFAIYLTLLNFELFSWPAFAVIILLLAALTPFPFFVSFLMPDVFAGIAILSIANLLVKSDQMSKWMILLWTVYLSVCLLFHSSHVLVAMATLVPGVALVRVMRRSFPAKGIVSVAIALLIAVAGEVFFGFEVKNIVGAPPIRPPFLMARMIADGPGYRYLIATCPSSTLTVCRFLSRLPISDSDEFLWSTDPAKGVFAIADPSTRRGLAKEQFRFALATFSFEPVGQLWASLRDGLRQLTLIGLSEFNYGYGERAFLITHVPEPYLARAIRSRAWSESMPIGAMYVLIAGTVVASALYLIGLTSFRRDKQVMMQSGLLPFTLVVVIGIAINAFVCGAFSNPLSRYQARVIWLLPFVAMLFMVQDWRRKKEMA